MISSSALAGWSYLPGTTSSHQSNSQKAMIQRSRMGAGEKPQFPPTTVVTPWRTKFSASG